MRVVVRIGPDVQRQDGPCVSNRLDDRDRQARIVDPKAVLRPIQLDAIAALLDSPMSIIDGTLDAEVWVCPAEAKDAVRMFAHRADHIRVSGVDLASDVRRLPPQSRPTHP